MSVPGGSKTMKNKNREKQTAACQEAGMVG